MARRPLRIALGATLLLPAPAIAEPALTMTCHLLIDGAPSNDPTVFMLAGPELTSRSIAGTTRLSTEGKPLFLSTIEDAGVETQTFADHARNGTTVIRRVYWQEGTGPRRLRFSERYDFAAGTLVMSGDTEDSCHKDGR